MKAKMMKLLILLILSHSVHSAKLKCYKGYNSTMNGKENDNNTFAEVECSGDQICVSAKGSYVHQGDNCELLKI